MEKPSPAQPAAQAPAPSLELSLSTVWARPQIRAAQADPGQFPAVLERLAQPGVARLELEYRLQAADLERLRRECGPRGWRATSVHNYVPWPEGLERPSGDAFNLAATDPEERLTAVRYTIRSLEVAADWEATACVLHLGSVPALADKTLTRRAADLGELTPELARAWEKRQTATRQVTDAVSFSLERIIVRAQALGVSLGLENRYHFFDVPTFDELELLLTRFAGAPVGLWYDCGHGFVQDRAGLTPAGQWFERLGQTLLGCHLHDSVGHGDHIPPGQGEMDWDWLCLRLLPATHKVMEVAHGEPDQMARGVALLREGFARAAARPKGQTV